MLAVLALALFSTALGYALYYRLIQNVGSTKALTVAYLISVFGVIWGGLLLHEPVTLDYLAALLHLNLTQRSHKETDYSYLKPNSKSNDRQPER